MVPVRFKDQTAVFIDRHAGRSDVAECAAIYWSILVLIWIRICFFHFMCIQHDIGYDCFCIECEQTKLSAFVIGFKILGKTEGYGNIVDRNCQIIFAVHRSMHMDLLIFATCPGMNILNHFISQAARSVLKQLDQNLSRIFPFEFPAKKFTIGMAKYERYFLAVNIFNIRIKFERFSRNRTEGQIIAVCFLQTIPLLCIFQISGKPRQCARIRKFTGFFPFFLFLLILCL